MVMTAAQKRQCEAKRKKMLAVMRKGGSDSAFTEELPESVQEAMKRRHEAAKTDDVRTD